MTLQDDLEILTGKRQWVPPPNDPLSGVVQPYEIRSAIAFSLGDLHSPTPEVIAALMFATFNDEHDCVSIEALSALIRIETPAVSIPVAVAATFHREETVRESALEQLANLDAEAAKIAAKRLQDDEDEGVRKVAKMIIDGSWWEGI